MSTEIKIKRGSGTTPTLADGELGFNKSNKTLTIGTDQGNVDIGRPIKTISQNDYDALGTKDSNTIYIIESDDAVVTQSMLDNFTSNLNFDKPEPRIHISANNTNTKLGICAGADDGSWYSSGASAFVYQNSNASYPGYFALNTGEVDGSQSTLIGKPNGDLIWRGNTVGLLAYPVDSIYMSVNSTSPASLFGGTWERLKDKFLLGAGDTYSAGSTGGEAAHALTEAEGPKHYGHHTPYDSPEASLGEAGEETYYLDASYSMKKFSTDRPFVCRAGNEVINRNFSKGSGTAHNNMPPYLTVYMWKRIA